MFTTKYIYRNKKRRISSGCTLPKCSWVGFRIPITLHMTKCILEDECRHLWSLRSNANCFPTSSASLYPNIFPFKRRDMEKIGSLNLDVTTQ